MGQRTQVLLVKKHNDGHQTAKLMHLQWGFGRQMYLAVMNLLIADYFKDTWEKGYSYDNVVPTEVFRPERERHWNCDVPAEVMENLDLDDIQSVKDVFDYGDNNNGGLVIQMTEAKNKYSASDFKIAFLLGPEDCYDYKTKTKTEEPFSRYLTPEEYGKLNGGSNYSDPEFVVMFNSFCDYFGIDRIGKDCDKFASTEGKGEE